MNCKNCEYGLPCKNGDFEKIICTYEEGECVKITELEAQIEKMKGCENCNNYQHRIDHRCNTKCKNLSEWEIKENDR